MYECTGIDDEKNADLKPMLAKIISISDIHDSSLLIVTHHKKHHAEYILSTDLIRGGSTFANAVDVIIQLAESLRQPGLRLMKITKNRGKSPLSTFLNFSIYLSIRETEHHKPKYIVSRRSALGDMQTKTFFSFHHSI